MVTDAFLAFICAVPNMLLDSFSSMVTFNIPQGTFDWWYNVFSVLTYVFPVWALTPIFTISISIKLTQIVWAILLKIKSFIPGFGS